MDKINLYKTLPDVFQDQKELKSDIWLKDLSFEKGKSYLVEANSGTGKSSLCSFIYGQRSDYQGTIMFDSMKTKELSSEQWDKIRCSELSFLFQELRLFPELTAIENVLLKNNLTNFKSLIEIEHLFDLLGICSKKNTEISKLSWGQQQRVAIIRCLCQPFDFLLLDEPISHLDDQNGRIIADLIQIEISFRGAAVISTSIGKSLPLSYDKIYSL